MPLIQKRHGAEGFEVFRLQLWMARQQTCLRSCCTSGNTPGQESRLQAHQLPLLTWTPVALLTRMKSLPRRAPMLSWAKRVPKMGTPMGLRYADWPGPSVKDNERHSLDVSCCLGRICAHPGLSQYLVEALTLRWGVVVAPCYFPICPECLSAELTLSCTGCRND